MAEEEKRAYPLPFVVVAWAWTKKKRIRKKMNLIEERVKTVALKQLHWVVL